MFVLLQVTAILVMYGLPRLLTGSILAHECMHAWFVLNYIDCCGKAVNEGLSQLMALMWLEAQLDQVCLSANTPAAMCAMQFLIVMSVLLYSGETWPVVQEHVSPLAVFQMNCLQCGIVAFPCGTMCQMLIYLTRCSTFAAESQLQSKRLMARSSVHDA